MTIDFEIKYDRETKDYTCTVDGRYIGSRSTYTMGETLCRQVIADLIADGEALTAAELDAASEPSAYESCGDASVSPICPACIETGERRDPRFDSDGKQAWRDQHGLLRWV
jgi:hypothetical protein